MKAYKQQDDYLISYEIENNEIVLNFYNEKYTYKVPNNQHNIEICERRLRKQFSDYASNAKFKKNFFEITPSILLLIVGFRIVLNKNIELIPLWLMSVSYCRVFEKFKDDIEHLSLLKHFELTNFCLEHITEINELVTDNKTTIVFSKEAQEAFNQDQGFTLNHSDQYHISDLKQLKKAINNK